MGCRVQSGLSRDCKHCGINAFKRQLAKFNLIESPGIEGLHSSWITDYTLGMQRLHQSNIHEIADKFVSSGIGAVFNLTQPGEHPYCGHELLESSGFSYDPNALMRKGIRFYNWNWEDMTAPSMSVLLDIVQVALHEINRGAKVAVHCHAGYGRTGTVIASVIMAKEGLDAQAAIKLVRQKRPGSVQKESQEIVIQEFESTWRDAMCEYPAHPTEPPPSTSPTHAPMTPTKKSSAPDTSFGPGTPMSAPASPMPVTSSDPTTSSSGGDTAVAAEPSTLPLSPPKSINKSVRDARMFHSHEEILGYTDNYLRFVTKSVIECCSILTTAASKGEAEAKGVITSFGAVDERENTEITLLRAKARINSGDWAVLKEVGGRFDVVSLLVLDWIFSRSDSLFESDTLAALCSSLNLQHGTSAAAALSVRLRPSTATAGGAEKEGEGVLARRLFAALVDTLQKPQLYLLDLLVRLLRTLCVSLKVEVDTSLPQHEHGPALLRAVVLLAISIAPAENRFLRGGGGAALARGPAEGVLDSVQTAIFGDGDATPVSAVACVLLSLAAAPDDVTVPKVLSPAKRRAIREWRGPE